MLPANQPAEADKSTKDKLFETAVDLFSNRGFSGVSIRDLTGAVGIKESSFYNHYKSKDELIEAIFGFYRTTFSQTMPPEEHIEAILATTSPDEFLRQGNARFMQHMATPLIQKIWRILFSEQFRDQRAHAIILQDMLQLPLAYAETVFAKMIELDLIRPLDPKILAIEYQYPVAFMVSTYLMLDYKTPNIKTFQKQFSDHIDFFWSVIKK
jgi:AcrR family transcriptional regulator